MKTICAIRHGTANPSTGVVKSITLERLLVVSIRPALGSSGVTGPNSRPCCFMVRKFGPFSQIRSTVPSLLRPAVFSATTRVTASAVSLSRTCTTLTPWRALTCSPAQAMKALVCSSPAHALK